ncbi:glycosyltransferase [Rossellomorea sp. NPDC077527]|uniref:glycosyltransferase n=1 Tax=Rossellomorea sp. NPDC077527 TaxID=3364510 RepID=UPI0037CA536A
MLEKFSVLLSVYNKEKPEYLLESLNSVLNQTIVPNEILIVKDGPLTSQLEKIIEEYLNNYPKLFKIINFSENKGLGIALRAGVEACSYEIIARMDTDDICHKTRFEKQLNFLTNNKEIAIVGTNALDFDRSINNVISSRVFPEYNREIMYKSKRRCPFLHPTVMFRRSAILKVGNYENLLWFEDYLLFLKLLKNGYRGYNLQENLLYFRSNEETYNRRGGVKYLVEEYKALTLFYKRNLFNSWHYLTNLMLRSIIRISGNKIRTLIYKTFLRKKNK